jgi:hypothetical protein
MRGVILLQYNSNKQHLQQLTVDRAQKIHVNSHTDSNAITVACCLPVAGLLATVFSTS